MVEITLTADDYKPLVEARDRRIAELGAQLNALVREAQRLEKLNELQSKEIEELKNTPKVCDCNGPAGTDHSAIPELEAT